MFSPFSRRLTHWVEGKSKKYYSFYVWVQDAAARNCELMRPPMIFQLNTKEDPGKIS
jgi:hypothetical protein